MTNRHILTNEHPSINEHYDTLTRSIIAIVESYTCEGYWSKAITILQSGVELLSDYKFRAAQLQARLGDLLWKTGQLSEAVTILEKAKTAAEEADDRDTLALTLYNLGEAYYIKQFMMQEKGTTNALDRHLQALELREQIGDQIGVIHSLSRIGVIYERLKDDDAALKCYQRAIELSESIDYPQGKTRPMTHIGVYHQRQGDRVKALDYFQQALATNQETGCREPIVFNLINVGRAIYTVEGDLDKALVYCLEALETAESLNFKLAIAQASFFIGTLYESSNDSGNARKYFEKTIATAQPLNYQGFLQIAQAKLE